MKYQIKCDKKTYEVKKPTLGIMKKVAELNEMSGNEPEIGSSVEFAQARYDFVATCIGEEAAEEILGGDIEEVDLMELQFTCDKIIDAWEAPKLEAEAAKNRAAIEEVNGILKKLKLDQLKPLENVANMAGLTAVK